MWVGGDPLIIFETTTGHDGLALGWVWPFDGLRLLVGFGIGGFFMLSPSTMVVVRSGPKTKQKHISITCLYFILRTTGY